MESEVVLSELQALFATINKQLLWDKIKCTVPIFEDSNGMSALDLALNEGSEQTNLANCLLKGIESYPYLHFGEVLVTGINKAFRADCPQFG